MSTSNNALIVFAIFLLGSVGTALAQTSGQPSAAIGPNWMWATGDRDNLQQVTLRKTFHADVPVRRAELRLATEFSRCELSLGDRVVLSLDDYGPWLDMDVTEHLGRGDEVIELRCEGSEGPSAILMELTITANDGRRIAIHSGEGWKARVEEQSPSPWRESEAFGRVSAELWTADRTARITPFDNYEQWRQASGGGEVSHPTKFRVRKGFEMERIRSAREGEGSWISLEFDPQGRLTIGREDKGLLRMTLSDDGGSVNKVETINDDLAECRGLVYRDNSLFAQANESKGMYRLDDQDGDGTYEGKILVREFSGGVGHGRNDLALGPDSAIYAIFGDSVDLPKQNVLDLTSPFREARRGQRTTEGHVLRFFPESRQWQLFCSGLRNPFGIDFNHDGEAFTYDADAEFDMGTPWYRPTRIVQLVPGGDYGWRGRTGQWPPFDADHADNTLASGDVGKGSPTAVKSGRRSAFPEPYSTAIFALDWAYGRVLACHLIPRGAGYVCRTETFLQGQPLNVTDLDFGPDGSLYLVTGGRKTHSDLYRVRFIGEPADSAALTPQQAARKKFSAGQRRSSRRLANWRDDAEGENAVELAWTWLGHSDPMLRDAARVVLEHQPLEDWKERAFHETRPSWIIASMLSLARSNNGELIPRILQRLLDVSHASLSGYDRSMLLETWSLCLSQPAARNSPAYSATVDLIGDWYPDTSPKVVTPVGAGRSVNHQLALLAELVQIPDFVEKTLALLSQARTQEERIHALFVLRNCRRGWTGDSRRIVFETLAELDRTALGGEGMPGFLSQIREGLLATMTDSELDSLRDLARPGTELEPPPLQVDRKLVKQWREDDLDLLLDSGSAAADHERGREMFRVALCSRCHRIGIEGGVNGPNLTSVANRFGNRDLLRSILEPSRFVDEKYRSTQVVHVDGRTIVGRIVSGGDYRSTKLKLATDPLRPSETIEIKKGDIESHGLSPQSPMPAGLLDTLSPGEIRDLLAYLEHSAFAASSR